MGPFGENVRNTPVVINGRNGSNGSISPNEDHGGDVLSVASISWDKPLWTDPHNTDLGKTEGH